ncbi:MAG TPA: DUF6193 family natural product biosynthesis protein [Pseudonocardiaceae bacterium]|jgi:hypothetical protein|nr:DUF6193 family natural product biosynthesis protein [Pseudonocardiaceae bacterium]
MPGLPDPELYPDVPESLLVAVRAEFDRAGRHWPLTSHPGDVSACRIDSPDRRSVARIRSSWIGVRERGFLIHCATLPSGPQSTRMSGVTAGLSEVAEIMHAWQSGISADELLRRHPRMLVKPAFDRERQHALGIAEYTWQQYLDPYFALYNPEFVRLLTAASAQPRLRTFQPFRSMMRLGFREPGTENALTRVPIIELRRNEPNRFVVRGPDRRELGTGDVDTVIALVVDEAERILGPTHFRW